MPQKILIELSARHIHLCQKDQEKLFGSHFKLKKLKDLSQPGLFASQETVDIQIGERKLKNVRVIGPSRPHTQIEVSKTDARFLHVKVPLRISGNIENSQGCTVIGPQGVVNLKEGLIVAKRHIHLSPKEAKKIKLKQGQEIAVKIEGERELIFHKVMTRIDPSYKAAVHLDTDEGNAAGIERKTEGEIIKISN